MCMVIKVKDNLNKALLSDNFFVASLLQNCRRAPRSALCVLKAGCREETAMKDILFATTLAAMLRERQVLPVRAIYRDQFEIA